MQLLAESLAEFEKENSSPTQLQQQDQGEAPPKPPPPSASSSPSTLPSSEAGAWGLTYISSFFRVLGHPLVQRAFQERIAKDTTVNHDEEGPPKVHCYIYIVYIYIYNQKSTNILLLQKYRGTSNIEQDTHAFAVSLILFLHCFRCVCVALCLDMSPTCVESHSTSPYRLRDRRHLAILLASQSFFSPPP